MNSQKMFRRILSLLISITLVLGMGVVSVSADGNAVLGTSDDDVLHLGTSGKIITAFAPLGEDIRFQNGMVPTLPETVEGTVDSETVSIPVTWETDTDPKQAGLHAFTAKVGDDYSLASGVTAPTIAFMRSSLARMAGVGTQAKPLQITNAAQLAEIAALVNEGKLEEAVFGVGSANKVHLKLMNNISLSGYGAGYNNGEGWVPIGRFDNGAPTYYFNGNFNGDGFVVEGLFINRSDDDQGLFGVIDAGGEVKNLGVVGGDIKGKNSVGGVAGRVEGTLTNCYATGSVSGNDDVGGVAGVVSGILENCYSTATVSGRSSIGGVAAWVKSGTLENCYATGIVSGRNYVGGVAGYISVSGTLTNCYATGSVSGTGDSVGGVAGGGAEVERLQTAPHLTPALKEQARMSGVWWGTVSAPSTATSLSTGLLTTLAPQLGSILLTTT